jgi:selenocysteine-specific elongation factor
LDHQRLVILEEGRPTPSSDLLAMALPRWEELRARTEGMVASYHERYPLRRGIPREELKSRLKLLPRPFNAVLRRLVAEDSLKEAGSAVAMLGHEIKFDAGQQARIEALMRKFAQSPHASPSLKECQIEVGEETVNALIELGQLVAVSAEVVFRKEDYDSMVAALRAALNSKGRITLAEVRDLFGTSRKYAQALLEHLDATGVTMRDGDHRKLRK